jgi:hypothetical protein
LWWTKRRWGRFYASTSVSPATHSTDCYTLLIIIIIIIIIIHYPGLAHLAEFCSSYRYGQQLNARLSILQSV